MGMQKKVKTNLDMNLECAANVSEMVNFGLFPVEFNVYGCAYWADNKPQYRVSNNIEKIYDYVQHCVYENIYPTLVNHENYSCHITTDEYEEQMERVKYSLARKMQHQYCTLFMFLQPLATQENNNAGYSLLLKMLEKIDGYYDEGELQLLEGAIDLAFRGKILNQYSYHLLRNETNKIRDQLDDDFILQDNHFVRTFWGFGYEDDSKIKYYYNAQHALATKKWQLLQKEGKIVMPIYQKTYCCTNSQQSKIIKESFGNELKKRQGTQYLAFIKQLKVLPGVISKRQLYSSIEKLKNEKADHAVDVMHFYSNQWNLCE